MVVIICGATHCGKTAAAQALLEKYHYPYLSIDHLKMGLIRSGNTELTPEDDEKLLPYLWGIVREIIKTAVENEQNLIIEGAYVPADWDGCFGEDYLRHIRCAYLIMSQKYIENNFDTIKKYSCVIEKRLDDSPYTMDMLIHDNEENLRRCEAVGCEYILIDDKYDAVDRIVKMIETDWEG